MADFLTRLAQRTLGLSPTIQPVVPSIFAPGTPLVVGSAEEEAAREAAPEDRAAQRQHGTRAAHVGRSAEDVERDETGQIRSPQPDAPESSSSVRSESSMAASVQPIVKPTPTPDRASADAELPEHATTRRDSGDRFTPALQPRAQITPLTRQADAGAAAPEPHASLEPSEPDTSAALRTRATAAQPRLVPPNRSGTSTRPALQPVTRPSTRDGADALPTVMPRTPEARERALPSTQPPLPSTEQQAAPTQHIHVSIGRIEVRAMTPSPQPTPRPTTPAAPKMSLDDYLRSKNGERR